MSFHKDVATNLIKEWSVKELDVYLEQLKARHVEEGEWIRTVQDMRRRLIARSKSAKENGPRDGR